MERLAQRRRVVDSKRVRRASLSPPGGLSNALPKGTVDGLGHGRRRWPAAVRRTREPERPGDLPRHGHARRGLLRDGRNVFRRRDWNVIVDPVDQFAKPAETTAVEVDL